MRIVLIILFSLFTYSLFSQSEGGFAFRRFATYSALTSTTVNNADKNASRKAYVHSTGKYYLWDGTQWVEEKLLLTGKQGILVQNDSILLGANNQTGSLVWSNRYVNFGNPTKSLIIKGSRSNDDLSNAPYIKIENKMQSGDPFGARMTFIDSVGSSFVGRLDIGSYDGGAFIYSNNWLNISADTLVLSISRLQAPNIIDSTHVKPGGLRGTDLNQMSATSGQVLGWNGYTWTPTTVSSATNVLAKQGLTRTVDSLFLGTKSNTYTVPTITDNRTNVSYSSEKGTVTMYNKSGQFLVASYTDSTQVGGILTTGYPSQGGMLLISPSDTSAYMGTTNGFSYTNIITKPETIRLQVNNGGIVVNTISMSDTKTVSSKIINYGSNLHSSYVNRTLVDKEFVVNYIDTTKISLSQLEQTSATSGQVIKWNGSQWAPANDVGGGSGDDWGVQVVVRDSSLQGTGVIGNALGIKGYSGASNGQIPSKGTGTITWITPSTGSGSNGQMVYWNGTNSQTGSSNFTVSGSSFLVTGMISAYKDNLKYETITSNSSTISGTYSIVYCNVNVSGSQISLPLDANVSDGDLITIFNLNSNTLDVNRNGSNQTINGALVISDLPQYGHITLHAKVTGPSILWLRHE